VSADAEADPWGGSSEAAADKDAGDQDGWANFCAFTSPSEEAAEGMKSLLVKKNWCGDCFFFFSSSQRCRK